MKQAFKKFYTMKNQGIRGTDKIQYLIYDTENKTVYKKVATPELFKKFCIYLNIGAISPMDAIRYGFINYRKTDKLDIELLPF
jgi:hypothetical protein